MTWIVFLLALGASLRMTRMFVDDSITDNLRTNLEIHGEPVLDKRFGRLANFFSRALNCPWCTSVWWASFVFGTAYFAGEEKWWQFGAAALTASWIIGIASELNYALEERIEREDFWHDHDEDDSE